jgi:hypothetical protein
LNALPEVFEPLFEVWAYGVWGTTAEMLSHPLDRRLATLQQHRICCLPHILTLNTSRAGEGKRMLQIHAIQTSFLHRLAPYVNLPTIKECYRDLKIYS